MKTPRPRGLTLIIAYKLTKAPLMFMLALWLTLAPREAYAFGQWLARELSEGGATLSRVGAWLAAHLSLKVVTSGEVVAWVDAISTTTEGVLLLRGKAWGEWLVVAGLSLLLPMECVSLERHPGVVKLMVLLINAAAVFYLFRLRLAQRRSRFADEGT